ncbi:YlxR family protein [Luedemannella helvata]|uniref:YlxR domain-containing protein n=1 Tax=Luedemannella helvata TaxID=349315 RepID=A0ABN2KLC7_9ACTN
MASGLVNRPGTGIVSAPVVRTCVGCRKRAAASELLRVVATAVADQASPGGAVAVGSPEWRLVPDHARRLPGRGAHLHPDPACFAQAERRRAFGRALRLTGVVDAGPVAAYVEAFGHAVGGARPPGDAR